jgi:hypothetical protein
MKSRRRPKPKRQSSARKHPAAPPPHQVGRARPKASEPAPGWPRGTRFVNARPPSVPTTLDLRLNEYYAGAVVIGLTASADREPNKKWARKWSFDMGDEMQAEALLRRRRSR